MLYYCIQWHLRHVNGILSLNNSTTTTFPPSVTGLLRDREAQICAFKAYTKHLASMIRHAQFAMELIQGLVGTCFPYVMPLSERWGRKEPLLRDVQHKAVYQLNPTGSIIKFQYSS